MAEQLEALANELRVVRDVLGEIREQLQHIASNGVPSWEPSINDRPVPPTRPALQTRPRCAVTDRDSAEARMAGEIIEELQTGIAAIATDQLALFVDALDDVRDELVAALKGNPQQSLPFDKSRDDGPVAPQPVLEKGAAQPTGQPACDRTAPQTDTVLAPRSLFDATNTPAVPRTLFESGDAVAIDAFNADGSDGFGEIVTVDDAYNTATVELIPSLEHATVSQDLLTKVQPDPLAPTTLQHATESDSAFPIFGP